MIENPIDRIWTGESCIVAATGPSLTPAVADACGRAHNSGRYRALAVNDAWRMMPWADALYACDAAWWRHHRGTDFAGQKWSSHHANGNDKLAVAKSYGLRLVAGKTELGFSLDAGCIHYGSNSGFQAVNLALLFGVRRIVLVGFNLRTVAGRMHFFGDHPAGLTQNPRYERFVPAFAVAASRLPADIEIINATPNSALRCFPVMALEEALTMERCAA